GYNFASKALTLSVGTVAINFKDHLLDFSGNTIALSLNPFDINIGSATVSSTKLSGFSGSVQNLDINSDGFSVSTATVKKTGTVTMGGRVISFTNLSLNLTHFAYSISQGASFQGTIG